MRVSRGIRYQAASLDGDGGSLVLKEVRCRAYMYGQLLPRAAHVRNRQKTIQQLQTHSIPTYTAAKAYLGLSMKFSTYHHR